MKMLRYHTGRYRYVRAVPVPWATEKRKVGGTSSSHGLGGRGGGGAMRSSLNVKCIIVYCTVPVHVHGTVPSPSVGRVRVRKNVSEIFKLQQQPVVVPVVLAVKTIRSN